MKRLLEWCVHAGPTTATLALFCAICAVLAALFLWIGIWFAFSCTLCPCPQKDPGPEAGVALGAGEGVVSGCEIDGISLPQARHDNQTSPSTQRSRALRRVRAEQQPVDVTSPATAESGQRAGSRSSFPRMRPGPTADGEYRSIIQSAPIEAAKGSGCRRPPGSDGHYPFLPREMAGVCPPSFSGNTQLQEAVS